MVSRKRTEGPGLGPRARLAILFATVLVDLIGFGIVLPLLPFYADRFGGTGVAIGFLVTVYSAAQLFSAPLWGRLSDRYGRRPILIVGLVSSGISYLVFAYATTLAAPGLAAAGLCLTNAVIAVWFLPESLPPEERGSRSSAGLGQSVDALGRIIGPVLAGFAFDGWGIGWPYIVGAAIGGVAFLVSLTVTMPGRR